MRCRVWFRASLSIVIGCVLVAGVARAQSPVVPSQPTKFKKRDITPSVGSGGGSVGIGPANPKQAPKKIYKKVQYIAVSESRAWTNEKGRQIKGMLLAFEDGPREKHPGPLTLIRDGKVRMLLEGAKKPTVFPLAALSKAGQRFIGALDAQNQANSKAKAKAKANPEAKAEAEANARESGSEGG